MIITIDGPAASGKSTIAKLVAKRLTIYYLQTGLLYRAIAYLLMTTFNRKPEHFDNLEPKDLGFIRDLFYDYAEGSGHVSYKGDNITAHLFDVSVDQPASLVSANPHVREALLGFQRHIAIKHDLVAEGRDCGSVVFPLANYKFFLTASLEVRARRVIADTKRGDVTLTLEEAKAEIAARDKRDTTRKVAPLTMPEDGIRIDNSNLSIEATVDEFMRHIAKARA